MRHGAAAEEAERHPRHRTRICPAAAVPLACYVQCFCCWRSLHSHSTCYQSLKMQHAKQGTPPAENKLYPSTFRNASTIR